MSQHAFTILLAGSFTFGCAAIHLWKDHATALTPPLAAALVCLSILVGSVAVVKSGGAGEGVAVRSPPQTSR